MKKIFKKILQFFLHGIFVIVPFILTIFFVIYPLNVLSSWIANFMNAFAGFFLTEEEFNTPKSNFLLLLTKYTNPTAMQTINQIARVKYMNIFCVALLITFFGILASSLSIQKGVKILEKMVLKIPGISFLYVYAKEFVATFVGKFDKPVLVTTNKTLSIQKIGFIIQENIHNLNVNEGKIAVYIPHSYALSGELYFLPKEDVIPLNITSAEAWKIVLSGGIAEIKPRHKIKD